MVNWEVLIIPLIAFGAWILSTIFKTGEDAKAKARMRRPENRPGARTPRRPAPPEAATQEEPRRRRDMPEGMESRQQRQRPGTQPNPTPSRPVAQPLRSAGQRRPAPVLAVVIEEPPKPVVRRAAVPENSPEPLVVPLPLPALSPMPAVSAAAPAKRERTVPPVLQEVVRLLRSPRTAAAALVMREILDRPVGLRRR